MTRREGVSFWRGCRGGVRRQRLGRNKSCGQDEISEDEVQQLKVRYKCRDK